MPAKVYLADPTLAAKSRHHRTYVGVTDKPYLEQSETERLRSPMTMKTVEFFNGVAKNVDERTYQVLKELGHIQDRRPFTEDDD